MSCGSDKSGNEENVSVDDFECKGLQHLKEKIPKILRSIEDKGTVPDLYSITTGHNDANKTKKNIISTLMKTRRQ